MSVQKFQVKVFVESPKDLDVEALIPVFHGFIRDAKLGEFVLDVADYGHVHEGPGVVLIGHGSDYYLDLGEGRPGLQYSRKRAFEGDTEAAFADAVKRALTAAKLLESDATLGVKFGLGDIVVRVNDRLAATNDDASLAGFAPLFGKVLGKALGNDVTLSREGDARELLTVRARGGKGTVDEALARLG